MLNIVLSLLFPQPNIDSNPINVAIHMVFVPLIYITAVILIGLSPNIPLSSNISISPADIGVAVYAIGYVLLEPVAGVLLLPFHFVVLYYAHVLPTQFSRDDIAKYAGGLQVLSWIAQFAGHGFAEGRAPALFANLFQVCSVSQLIVVIVFGAVVCLVGDFILVWISTCVKACD
jgi:2-hydroxy fatty acid dioxygenase